MATKKKKAKPPKDRSTEVLTFVRASIDRDIESTISALIGQADKLDRAMKKLISGLKRSSDHPVDPNGEVKKVGVDIDRLCAELAAKRLLRDMVS